MSDEKKEMIKGIMFCIAIAIPAFFLGKQIPIIGGPVFGILIGMIITLIIKDKERIKKGINFTSKKILQYAVILLGFGLNLSVIFETGKQSLPVICATITTSLLVSYVLCKTMRIPEKISILVGVGSSICGGSAIAASAPVIDADDEEIAQAISVIFLFNVIAALIFPSIGIFLGISNEGFALFAGTAVNDTSSVTAAAAAWDDMNPGSNTLELATIVKLTRTLAIIPICLGLAFIRGQKEKTSGKKVNIKNIFPMFILYFLLASVVTTIFDLPISITEPIKNVSKFFIVMAMSAIGLNTNIVKLIKSGSKPIFMGFCCWVAIACVSLIIQHFIGAW